MLLLNKMRSILVKLGKADPDGASPEVKQRYLVCTRYKLKLYLLIKTRFAKKIELT